MPILIAKVGSDAKDPLVQMGQEYLARLRAPFHTTLKSVAEQSRGASSNHEQILQKEGQALLKACSNHQICVLHDTGKQYTSPLFAKWLDNQLATGQSLAFIIGGATGFWPPILSEAQYTLSLSSMTLPHRLAFCVLAEQLYRAQEMIRGGPYHK